MSEMRRIFFTPLQPRDIIAFIIVGGYVAYTLLHGNTMIPASVMLIVGYYFGRRSDLYEQIERE